MFHKFLFVKIAYFDFWSRVGNNFVIPKGKSSTFIFRNRGISCIIFSLNFPFEIRTLKNLICDILILKFLMLNQSFLFSDFFGYFFMKFLLLKSHISISSRGSGIIFWFPIINRALIFFKSGYFFDYIFSPSSLWNQHVIFF